VQPDVKLERRISPLFALFFYGFLALAAALWLYAKAGPAAFRALVTPRNPLLDVGLGLGAGALIAAGCASFASWWGAARDLEKEFGWILGEQRKWECAVLAVVSGVAEEFFFRGAVWATVSPWIGTAIFAVLHWPVSRAFRLWPFLALAAGAVLAMERQVTGGLIAPIITHVTVNAVNLWRITTKYRNWSE
jgi:hypothetical protein